MKILRKTSALQSHLSTSLPKLRPSTTLIISSAPAPPKTKDNQHIPQKTDQDLKKFHTGLEQHIGQCQFFTSMQFNLKTVSYGNKTLSGAYPTNNDVDAALELMRRTGATNVVGVGSGAAIDLAKACFTKFYQEGDGDSNGGDGAELILNPGTLGATLAAASKDCLILCPEEEALLPLYSSNVSEDSRTIVVDDKTVTIPSWISSNDATQLRKERGNNATITDTALASLVIAIDAAHALGDIDEEDFLQGEKEHYANLLNDCVESAMTSINTIQSSSVDDAIQASQMHAISSMLNAGQLLSFGHSKSLMRRNISLALSSALLPKYFPHGNFSTFTASLLPGLCLALEETSNELDVSTSRVVEWVQDGSIGGAIPSLSSLAEGAPDTTELITKVEDNGAFLNCKDADYSFIESLLVSNLNR